jgi:hypothetical protein
MKVLLAAMLAIARFVAACGNEQAESPSGHATMWDGKAHIMG